MKVLIVLCAFVTASFGVGVQWNDLRVGNVVLPTTVSEAEYENWYIYEKDSNLKVTWYRYPYEGGFSVGFDGYGNCAGVRIIVKESTIESNYLSLYKQSKGIFRKTKIDGVTAYTSTVLFTDYKILKSGGRQMQQGEEVALGVYLEVNGKYTRISREACVLAQTYQEQSCQSNYGLVLSYFGKKSSCNTLIPFFAKYDPVYDGDLTGFGWLSFHQENNQDSFFQCGTYSDIESIFPQSPSCLTSCSNVAVLDVWLSYHDALEASCSSSNWVSAHCKTEYDVRPVSGSKSSDSKSSGSSDSSDSSDSDDSD